MQAAQSRDIPLLSLVLPHNLVPEQDDSDNGEKNKTKQIYLPAHQGSPLWEPLNIQDLPMQKAGGVAPALRNFRISAMRHLRTQRLPGGREAS